MKKRLAVFAVLLAVAWIASAEPDLEYGYDGFVIYYSGTCGSGKSYHGHYELDCSGHPHYQGTRSGQWRLIAEDNCDYPYDETNVYQVCTNGSNCTDANGTWVEITQAQFDANYCP
jgi:hypothetical protein